MTITREEFMEFFRDEEGYDSLTVDDCLEIFVSCLRGSSDITAELFEEVCCNCGVDYLDVLDGKND